MDKKIKESKRGLTFSFTPTETQFRKHMGLSQSVPIRLTGKMTVC